MGGSGQFGVGRKILSKLTHHLTGRRKLEFDGAGGYCVRGYDKADQSHPKPLGLTSLKSEAYPRNGSCQSHLSYLQLFQCVSPSKGAYFSKKIVECVQAVPVGRREPEQRPAVPVNRRRTPLCNNCTKPVKPLGSIDFVSGSPKNAKKHPHPQSQNVNCNQQFKSKMGATPKARMSFGISKMVATSNARKTPFLVEICTKLTVHSRQSRESKVKGSKGRKSPGRAC